MYASTLALTHTHKCIHRDMHTHICFYSVLFDLLARPASVWAALFKLRPFIREEETAAITRGSDTCNGRSYRKLTLTWSGLPHWLKKRGQGSGRVGVWSMLGWHHFPHLVTLSKCYLHSTDPFFSTVFSTNCFKHFILWILSTIFLSHPSLVSPFLYAPPLFLLSVLSSFLFPHGTEIHVHICQCVHNI